MEVKDESKMAAAGRPLCKIVAAVLLHGPKWLPEVLRALENRFGPVDYRGKMHAFDHTDYYRDEFGEGLWRGILSFRGVANPENLVEWKRKTREIEQEISPSGKRICNIDIGYLDPDKLVLGSFKSGPLKVYLGNGVFADILVKYGNGRFEPMPWAFPDFKDTRYHASLIVIREKLKSDLRKRNTQSGPSPEESLHA